MNLGDLWFDEAFLNKYTPLFWGSEHRLNLRTDPFTKLPYRDDKVRPELIPVGERRKGIFVDSGTSFTAQHRDSQTEYRCVPKSSPGRVFRDLGINTRETRYKKYAMSVL